MLICNCCTVNGRTVKYIYNFRSALCTSAELQYDSVLDCFNNLMNSMNLVEEWAQPPPYS